MRRLARQLVVTTLAAAAASGGGGGPPPSTATFTLQPVSDHTRRRACFEGTHGHTAAGRYLRIPSGDGGTTPNRYVFFTKDDGTGRYVGIDPGAVAAELSGYTGIEVQLGAGDITGAQRATATRSALSGLYTIGGTGDVVTVTGQIGACTTGGIFGGTRGCFGTRRTTPQFDTNVLNGAWGQFGIWSSGDVLITALGIRLSDTTTPVRLGLYTGGTQASRAGTAVLAEVLIPSGGAVGWNWRALTPSEVGVLSNGNFRLVAKSNGSSIPGYIGTNNLVGTDFPDSGSGSTYDLEVYDTGVPNDPSTNFPSSLSGATVSTAPVYALIAFQYIAGDGTSGVFVTRFGTQISDPTDLGQTSSLTAPDINGANLGMGAPAPALLGMRLAGYGIAFGDQHTSQLRQYVTQGGTQTDETNAVLLWESLSSGSATNQWVETTIGGNVAVAPNAILWWCAVNNAATVNFRFAFNAQRETNSPDYNPADWTDESEFEMFSDNTRHSTDPTVAVVSPIDGTAGGATPVRNTNYPGAYLLLEVPADIAA